MIREDDVIELWIRITSDFHCKMPIVFHCYVFSMTVFPSFFINQDFSVINSLNFRNTVIISKCLSSPNNLKKAMQICREFLYGFTVTLGSGLSCFA